MHPNTRMKNEFSKILMKLFGQPARCLWINAKSPMHRGKCLVASAVESREMMNVGI